MLIKLVGKLIKNLKFIILFLVIGIVGFSWFTRYSAVTNTPLGALVPKTSAIKEAFTKLVNSGETKKESTPLPSPTTYPKNIKATILTQTGDVTFSAETATTPEERAVGLMYRASLPEYSAMFFVHEFDNQYGYWMKNCEFAQDMLFIDKEFKIIDIFENVPPCKLKDPAQKNCPIYAPKSQYRYVLELNAGTVKKVYIRIGDTIKTN